MLIWIIKISVASICFIFLVHHLICFLKNTLTIPKTKDLVNLSSEKYNKMCSILEKNKSQEDFNQNVINLNNCTSIDSLPTDSNNMKDELKSFLKDQLKGNSNTNPSLDTTVETYDLNETKWNTNYSSF